MRFRKTADRLRNLRWGDFMANREKGEASFQIGEKTYTLRVDIQAWAWAQDALSKGAKVPAIELLTQRLAANHMMTILAVFGGSLQRYHEHEAPDLRRATDLFEKSGGAAADALAQAIIRSSPDHKDLDELGVEANPPKAQAAKKQANGTGETSVSKSAVLA